MCMILQVAADRRVEVGRAGVAGTPESRDRGGGPHVGSHSDQPAALNPHLASVSWVSLT